MNFEKQRVASRGLYPRPLLERPHVKLLGHLDLLYKVWPANDTPSIQWSSHETFNHSSASS